MTFLHPFVTLAKLEKVAWLARLSTLKEVARGACTLRG